MYRTPRLLRLFKVARLLKMLKLLRIFKVQKYILKVKNILIAYTFVKFRWKSKLLVIL